MPPGPGWQTGMFGSLPHACREPRNGAHGALSYDRERTHFSLGDGAKPAYVLLRGWGHIAAFARARPDPDFCRTGFRFAWSGCVERPQCPGDHRCDVYPREFRVSVSREPAASNCRVSVSAAPFPLSVRPGASMRRPLCPPHNRIGDRPHEF